MPAAFLNAYGWQYILSGASHPHFQDVLFEMISPAQNGRVLAALGSLDQTRPKTTAGRLARLAAG